VYGDYADLTTWDTGGHANSVYFETLADTGLPGLAAFMWLTWRLVRTSFELLLKPLRASKDVTDAHSIWRLALAASLCSWFVHGLLDYFYEPLPTNLAFWLVAGLVLAAADGSRPRQLNVQACASPST
jgi:O-antigen ligase